MKIPMSWIREFVDVPADTSLETLEDAFVKVGFEIESIQVLVDVMKAFDQK